MTNPDLFEFAYIPSWYLQLDELAELALPESWRFKNPDHILKNEDNPILVSNKNKDAENSVLILL